MARDNGLYLRIATVPRLWSTRPGSTCTRNCYLSIYHDPFAMFRWEPTWVAFDPLVAWLGMMGLKKVMIVLCWWVVVAFLSFNHFFLCLLSSFKNSPKHRSSPYIWAKALIEEAEVTPVLVHKNNTMASLVFFQFHPSMAQLADSGPSSYKEMLRSWSLFFQIIQFNDIGSYNFIFFHFSHVQVWPIQAILEWG